MDGSEPNQVAAQSVTPNGSAGQRRAAAIPVELPAKTPRAVKFMRRDLAYMQRYAPMIQSTEEGRRRFDAAMQWARAELATRLAGLDPSWLEDYASAPVLHSVRYDAEYACTLAYIDLIRVSDRIFFALHRPAAREKLDRKRLPGMRADIYRILRNVVIQSAGGAVDLRVSTALAAVQPASD